MFRKDFITNLFGRRRAPSAIELPSAGAVPDVPVPVELFEWDDEIDESTDPVEFFPDKPSRHDYLDYKSYSETLADLIALKQTQTPLTVGVFGAWGSGKTTLMRMIESSLREKETEPAAQRFVFVRFDAWKYYKEDALWRAMLLRVLDALRRRPANDPKNLQGKIAHLEESLYRDVEWQEKGGLTIDWPKLIQAGAGGALKLTFSFVPGLSTLVQAVQAAQKKIGEGAIADDVSSIAAAFQRDVVTHHQRQLRHIEQFQREFSGLVKDHFTDQRLVIFVDDLDRCLPEKAIEVLEAIKLFLDVKGCVFILGIDQDVITRGLEAKYKDFAWASARQQAEFSRHYIEKLIQLPFHLPPIEAGEVHSYISLLNVKWPEPDCAKIFAEALSPNPRQIKRTINVFMLLWKLAQKRRESLGEAVTALRLAKVVILQTTYPQVFDHLKSDARLLKQLESVCCEANSNPVVLNPVLADAVTQAKLKTLFQLLHETESASFANLDEEALAKFFSLARRAPLVTEVPLKAAPAPDPSTQTATRETTVGPVPERPFQLRPAVRDFVGRKSELERLAIALRQEGAIAIVTGMAGVGKTEFAFRVAEELRADYPDGQLFFDMLGTESSPAIYTDALAAFIRALGGLDRAVPPEADERLAIYRSLLNEKRVLIMLDNVADAAQVTPLIPPKKSALLVTSRNALVLPGMFPIILDQLSVNDAVQLFLYIAPHAREVAEKICELCGYLPLAVRAAASTLAATADLEPHVYAQQLSVEQKRIEVLQIEGVNVKLEASFNLVYSGLNQETARVFRELSTFSESFAAEAEEIVCDDPGHMHLSELVKRSLVFFEPSEKRYRVHPLLRLFAQRQQPESGKRDAAARRHAKFYLDVLNRANALYSERGEKSLAALELYDLEQGQILAGFQWSAEKSIDDAQAAGICSRYARNVQILELRLDAEDRVEWFTAAMNAARRSDDQGAWLAHAIDLSRALVSLGREIDTTDLLNEALAKAQQLKLLPAEAKVYSNLGIVARNAGDVEAAIGYFNQQLRISRELAAHQDETNALVNLANTYLLRNDTENAIEYFEKAREISAELGDLQTEGLILGNLGRAYNKLGDTEHAMALCLEQLRISRTLGDKQAEAAAHLNIGMTWQRKGNSAQARLTLQTSLKLYEELQSSNADLVRGLLTLLDNETDA